MSDSTPTIDEIDDKVTSLYHLQRVNMEAADEFGRLVRPLWQSLPETQALRDVATKPKAHRYLYDEQRKYGGTSFTKTAKLAPLLEPDNWPAFHTGETQQAHVETWIELIGHSEEAKAIQTSISETGNELTRLLNHRPLTPRPAQNLRGWYVQIGTSRRGHVGWVVGGRGNSIQIQPDTLYAAERLFTAPSIHRAPVTDTFTAKMLARTAFGTIPEVQKYSMKTANISLRLPPDMARERREWSVKVTAMAHECRDEARDLYNAYAKWNAAAQPIRERDEAVQKWNKGLPKSLHENWVVQEQMRWIVGGTEAIELLLDLMPEADVRMAIIGKYRAKHTELFVSDAERAFLASPPALGAEDFEVTFANVMKSKYSGFAPMF